jgi:hypothetical protein
MSIERLGGTVGSLAQHRLEGGMWKTLVLWLAKQGAQWALSWARKKGWL